MSDGPMADITWQINSQHETLLRKWNDLKRTFA